MHSLNVTLGDDEWETLTDLAYQFRMNKRETIRELIRAANRLGLPLTTASAASTSALTSPSPESDRARPSSTPGRAPRTSSAASERPKTASPQVSITGDEPRSDRSLHPSGQSDTFPSPESTPATTSCQQTGKPHRKQILGGGIVRCQDCGKTRSALGGEWT